MQQLKAPIVSAIEAVKGAYLFRIQALGIAAVARPGQFVMVRCGNETILPRPFSIHSAADGEISLLVGVVGKGTEWLSCKKQGDALDIFGPLGNGYTLAEKANNILLVAGGLGIAPLRFLAETAAGAGKQVTILNGARNAASLIPVMSSQGMFNKGVRAEAVHCFNATEDGSEGFKGLATQLIPHYLEKIDQVFACGPISMYKTMAQMEVLKNKHVQVSMEIMMGCGTGVCYGCTIKVQNGGLKQVCKDGPVFLMEEIIF
jgi:dihydroorotate dehydrogenase electron transfer subunit